MEVRKYEIIGVNSSKQVGQLSKGIIFLPHQKGAEDTRTFWFGICDMFRWYMQQQTWRSSVYFFSLAIRSSVLSRTLLRSSNPAIWWQEAFTEITHFTPILSMPICTADHRNRPIVIGFNHTDICLCHLVTPWSEILTHRQLTANYIAILWLSLS